ncbi:MAG: hypothetical protein K8H75_16045 [Sulfuricella sp.]|nr:hypothetical protein [Sulfuricella sp.]
MARQSRFYLARVLKRGELTKEKIVEAMREPVTIEFRGTRYSFTDFRAFGAQGQEKGFYARLAKYRQQGAVGVVREDEHASAEAEVRNLIDASSAFVYLPDYSGLAYRHIWNALPREQFERVFKELVEYKFLLAGCDIDPVTDLRTFVMRLSKLDRITELQAAVSPPNPLFAPCWKSLSDYLRKRRLTEIQIKEQADSGIDTRVKEIAEAVLRAEITSSRVLEMMEPLLDGVGDAALLMAADGYGRARVRGREGDQEVVIRTSENQKSFLLDTDPEPEVLFERAFAVFQQISEERGLEHP